MAITSGFRSNEALIISAAGSARRYLHVAEVAEQVDKSRSTHKSALLAFAEKYLGIKGDRQRISAEATPGRT